MNPSLATVVYSLGIGGLFYLNLDRSERTSKALWIPVIWFWIIGSRPVSAWLGGGNVGASAEVMMEGSPIDAIVFQMLLAAGIAVLARRRPRPVSVMAANLPIILYFSYCLMSVVWSDFPWVATKRWIKSTGDLVMALIIVTDLQPATALRRLLSRVGFVLLPASVLLIKYYPYLGRGYDVWSGEQHVNGVTLDKNLLGLITYVLAVGALWQVLRLWRESDLPNRSRQLLAQCTLLGFGIWLLSKADSATSETCFIIATFVMLATGLRRIRSRPAAVHSLIFALVLLGGLIKVTGADTAVFHALGRKADLTGRASDIWPLLIPMAPNALIGAGFESFWLGPRLLKVWAAFPNLYVDEAHNGYIEVYLNLGAIGVGLISLIIIHGYRRSVAAFRNDPGLAGLALAYVLSAAMYSYTEAGFRMLDSAWAFLLLAVVGAGQISKGGSRKLQPNSSASDSTQVPVAASVQARLPD
jgi:exopolysaccharide production protein ExoQ